MGACSFDAFQQLRRVVLTARDVSVVRGKVVSMHSGSYDASILVSCFER